MHLMLQATWAGCLKSTSRERMAFVTMAMCWGKTEQPMRMGGFVGKVMMALELGVSVERNVSRR